MGKLDILILIIIGLVGLKCYFMGFTRSIWGLAAIVSGIFVAGRTWTYLADLLYPLIKNHQIVRVISMLIIAVAVAVVVDFIFKRLSAIVRKGVIGWIDNALGIAFGVALASILIGGILILLEEYANAPIQKFIAQSQFAPYLLRFTRYVIGVGRVIIDKSDGVAV